MNKNARHNIYVIELDRAVLKDKKFLEANPDFDDSTNPLLADGLDNVCWLVG